MTNDVLRAKIESDVAAFLSDQLGAQAAERYVIAHAFGVKSVRESALNDEAEILVRRGDAPRYFSDESKLFASINAAFADNFVEIYAPIQWPTPEGRNLLREGWRLPVREIVTRLCLEHRRSAT